MSFSKVNEEITVFDKEYELIGLDRHLGVHIASVVSSNTADSLLIICKIIALDMSRWIPFIEIRNNARLVIIYSDKSKVILHQSH